MPSSSRSRDLALLHAGVEDAVDAGRVDRGEELVARSRRRRIGDLGAARTLSGTTASTPGDLGDLVGDGRREPAEAAEPAALALHDEVAGEPAGDLLVDRGLGRGGEHGDEPDERHADEQGRRGGRRALRAAGGVLHRQLAGDAAAARRCPCRRAARWARRAPGPTVIGGDDQQHARRGPPAGCASVLPSPIHAAEQVKAPRSATTTPSRCGSSTHRSGRWRRRAWRRAAAPGWRGWRGSARRPA